MYARSAAQRAIERMTTNAGSKSDATFEAVWWISACDGYLMTAFGDRWKSYKNDQPWKDLLNGILWARNQTLHDPLALVPIIDTWVLSGNQFEYTHDWRWAPHEQIPISKQENGEFARSYRFTLEGRSMEETLREAVDAIANVFVEDVAYYDSAST
jgi:hypothetical protein